MKITCDGLKARGYRIENAKITSVSLNMKDCGVLTLYLTLEGCGWGVSYGGYVLGKGYLGATEFEGSAKGLESIMRIMNVVGVKEFSEMEGEYVRAALKGWGEPVKIIGSIIKDEWFDYGAFFKEDKVEER